MAMTIEKKKTIGKQSLEDIIYGGNVYIDKTAYVLFIRSCSDVF